MKNISSILALLVMLLCSSLFTLSMNIKKNKNLKSTEGNLKELLQQYETTVIRKASKKAKKYFTNLEHISHEEFETFFKHTTFGKIAVELANDHKYVQEYYDYFADEGVLNEGDFDNLYGLLFLEQQLLIAGIHPNLSKKYPNKDNLKGGKAEETAINYWNGVNQALDKLEPVYHFKSGIDVNHLQKIIEDLGHDEDSAEEDANDALKFFSENEAEKLTRDEFAIFAASYLFQMQESIPFNHLDQ